MSKTFTDRLLKAIPGGAHTYSRGFDQYPSNAPQILSSGKGAYVFDQDNKKFLDYGMALRAVNIGYAEEEIDKAAINQINSGNNLSRPSLVELEAAELIIDTINSVDMVKFTKNGSTAVSAAVKLARAYTGKELIARCADHPFFSFDDWFIGSTNIKKGIPDSTIQQTKLFKFHALSLNLQLLNVLESTIKMAVAIPIHVIEIILEIR
jgi:glutamate-1-semialdehyde 2,1-aminomutase